jgi:acetyltransferase-like isoleucine patch superfamily enzyme
MQRQTERRGAGAPPSRQLPSRRLPDSNERPGLSVVLRIALHVAIVRTLYLRVRYGGWCVVSRGTRLKIGPGSRLLIPDGSFLFLGFAHFTPAPSAVHLGRDATLSVRGTAQIHRGSRVFVHDGARLEIGNRSFVNDCSTVTCFQHITIGSGCAISWNTNILDTNAHELAVAGQPRPRSGPVTIGDQVWIGTGATVLAGVTIGDGAVIAAGSVVTAAVPGRALAAGNPARVIREDVSWH